MNLRTTQKVLELVLKIQETSDAEKFTPCLWGQAGIGKSAIVKNLKKTLKYDRLVDIRLGQMEAGDILGLPSHEFYCSECNENYGTMVISNRCAKCNGLIKCKMVFAPPAWFPMPGERVLIFLDEINRSNLQTRQAVMQMVLDRRVHTYVFPKETGLIAAANPPTEEYSVEEMDTALMSRLMNINIEPTVQEWLDWGKSASIAPEILNFIATEPNMLGIEMVHNPITIKQNPRAVHFLSTIYSACRGGGEWLEIAYSLVGHEFTQAFRVHLQNEFEQPVKAEDLLFHWDKVKSRVEYQAENNNLPVLARTGELLTDRIKENSDDLNKKEYANVYNFLKLLPADTRVMLIKACTAVPALAKNVLAVYNDLFLELKSIRDNAEE